MTDTTEVLSAELVPAPAIGRARGRGGGRAVAAGGRALRPSQAAATTKRTYRSTLRSFALFCEHELGLPATVEALTLDTVLDYSAWLHDLDEDTDEPRCHPRTVAKQLSAVRGFARWLAMVPELRIDPRIQHIRIKALCLGPCPSPQGSPVRLSSCMLSPVG